MDKAERRKVLEGSLSQLQYKPLSRSVRIYLSSEYTDTVLERKAVGEHVFPQLRSCCQSLGLQFTGVDLYESLSHSLIPCQARGQGEEEHDIFKLELGGVFELAVKEVEMCREISSGPAFITLLAQRYGHKLLHRRIPQVDFEHLLAAVEESSARQLVEMWYKLDANALSPQFCLQTFNQRVVGMEEWMSIHTSLSKTLRKAARVALGKDVHKVQRFIMSAVEEEVTHGVFDCNGNPNLTCSWFKRVFTDLFEQRTNSEPALLTFTDMTSGRRGLEFDSENVKMLNQLKEARLPAKYIGLDNSNIFEFMLRWQKGKGLHPTENTAHETYLKDLCVSMVDAVNNKLGAVYKAVEEEEENQTFVEVLHHTLYGQKKIKTFMDRPALMDAVYQYFSSDSDVPFVIHGEVGSGKTFLMARASRMLHDKLSLQKKVLVMRFVGHTPCSSNIRNLLRSICEQLSQVFDKDMSLIPGSFSSLMVHFKHLLGCASPDRHIYVLLDGVDQLSPEDGAYGMSWLPSKLPPHVKLVLSSSSEVQYHCYPVLRSLLADHPHNILQVLPMGQEECESMLTHQLQLRGRTLTRDQRTAAMLVLLKCPVPLYMDLLLIEVEKWTSFQEKMPWRKTPPPANIRDTTTKYFQNLESEFGIVVISRLASYLSSSKHGLTEMELLDLMSSDAQVMYEVNKKWRRRYVTQSGGGGEEASEDISPSPLQTLPSLLWSQLYHKLVHFLGHKVGSGGYQVLHWRTRHTAEFVASRYLTPDRKMKSIAGTLADYFMKQTTPPQSSEDQRDDPETNWTADVFLDTKRTMYNVRKLIELPHSLQKSGRLEELQELLFSYEWLKAKIVALSCSELIEDFFAVCPAVPLNVSQEDRKSLYELRLLRDAMSLSIESLNADSAAFPQQICGRLLPYVENDGTKPSLKKVVTAALEDSVPPLLLPLQSLQSLPGGPLLVTMNGHRDAISGVSAAMVRGRGGGDAKDQQALSIVSSSWDKTLKSWDLDSGGVLKTFDGHTDKVLSVSMTTDGQFVASGSADTTARFWCVFDARCLYVLQGHSAEVSSVVLSSDGSRTISASLDCTIKVWSTDQNSSSRGQLIYTMNDHGRAIQTLALSRDTILASGDSGGIILVSDIIAGGILCRLKGRGAITALNTADIDCVECLLIGTASGQSVVKELRSGRSIQNFMWSSGSTSAITAMAAAPDGKVVISNGDKQLSVWSLSEGRLLHQFTGHPDTLLAAAIADGGNLVISGCADSSLQIWDLLNSPVVQTTPHPPGPTAVCLSPCGAYGISGGADSTLNIYDMKTMDVLQRINCPAGQPISQVLVLRDSNHILVGFFDGSIQYWNGVYQKCLMRFSSSSSSPVTCMDVSPNSELVMAGNRDSTVSFWNLKTGEKLKTIKSHSTSIVTAVFRQGQIFTASSDGQIHIRCFRTTKVTGSMSAHADGLTCLSVSPNAKFLVAGSKEGACHVIDAKTGLLEKSLSGHREALVSIQVLSDFNHCLTASQDGCVRMWDLNTATCISQLHLDPILTSCSAHLQQSCVIYGTASGWVSAATYWTQSGPGTKKLDLENFTTDRLLSSASSSTSDMKSSVSTESRQAIAT